MFVWENGFTTLGQKPFDKRHLAYSFGDQSVDWHVCICAVIVGLMSFGKMFFCKIWLNTIWPTDIWPNHLIVILLVNMSLFMLWLLTKCLLEKWFHNIRSKTIWPTDIWPNHFVVSLLVNMSLFCCFVDQMPVGKMVLQNSVENHLVNRHLVVSLLVNSSLFMLWLLTKCLLENG